jgi:hypothetical protein
MPNLPDPDVTGTFHPPPLLLPVGERFAAAARRAGRHERGGFLALPWPAACGVPKRFLHDSHTRTR